MHVLVGGPPGSGKTTVAAPLAAALGLPLLSKDAVKDALADVLGRPADLEASKRLGRAAVHAVLTCARTMPGSVIDSTWFDYARPLVATLEGPLVEVRCDLPEEEALRRVAARGGERRARAELRDPAHLRPLGVGPVVTVDTSGPVDIAAVAAEVQRLAV